MKHFLIVASCASVIVAGMLASTQAQPAPTARARAIGIDQVRNGPKYANPDLAVVQFSGSLSGANYVLGGKVTNVGNAAHTRTRSGVSANRQLQLFLVQGGGFGKGGSFTLLRTFAVPSLKAKESFVLPTITIPARQVPGPVNAQFVLKLTGSDVESANDWKQTIAYQRL